MIKIGELREQIAQNAKRTKNKLVLERMEVVTYIMHRSADDEEFLAMTEAENYQNAIICTILRIRNPRLLRNLWIIAGTLADSKKNVKKE